MIIELCEYNIVIIFNFSESLRFLVNSLYDEVTKQQTDIKMADIRWVVTVPAIWSDPAKALMRRSTTEVSFSIIFLLTL